MRRKVEVFVGTFVGSSRQYPTARASSAGRGGIADAMPEGVLQQLFFIYTIYPRLLAQKTQKVRVRALKKVVVTQTLPVRVPSWPICLAMT